jgi:hypothetical protein
MRADRHTMTVKSAFMPSVALMALGLMASGNIFAASDSPRGRHKQQQQSQQPAPAPEPAAVAPLPQARPADNPQIEDKPVIAVPDRPAAVVIDSREAAGVLGREVRSPTDENMGRIVDMLVDQSGQIRAAIIDFGGFLGVGSRKIAVDWKALRFPIAEDRKRVVLEMSREQVRAAPEYQEGKPIFVLSAAGRGPVLVTTGSAGR